MDSSSILKQAFKKVSMKRKSMIMKSRAAESAFTLVEIMVVLVIIGLLGTFLFGKVFSTGEKAKAKMTKLKMQTLSQKVGEYKLMYNALPQDLTDLTGCNQTTGEGCIPLLEKNSDDLVDGWGNPFSYTADGAGRTFRITSLGADGKAGGEGVDFDFYQEGP
ncbi:MAG: type II secretion system protein GspG [Bdellovibrionales bacterium]|nr:type II secretion system protein GspG [Bdellovibrionales bacterium]